MYATNAQLKYKSQDILASSPSQLVVKLYDLGIQACNRNDAPRLRKVLIELISGLNFSEGGDLALRLSQIYEFCMRESVSGNLDTISSILTDLRDTWKEGVLNAT